MHAVEIILNIQDISSPSRGVYFQYLLRQDAHRHSMMEGFMEESM